MQITGNQIGINQLVRNDAKGAAAISSTQPTADKVIDLSQGDDETIKAELNITDATFLKVKSGKTDVYLDLSTLSATEKKTLVTTLKDQIMAYGEVKNAFDPSTFFKLTSTGSLQIGNTANTKDALYKADVMDAQKVLDKSLEKNGDAYKDPTFVFMNGTTNKLTSGDPKPGEWYNGFQVKKNDQGTYEVSTYVHKSGGRDEPKLTLAQYKDMVKKDFNFNGAVGAINTAAFKELGYTTNKEKQWVNAQGKLLSTEEKSKYKELAAQKFVDSVNRQFDPSHPTLSKDELTQIAKEVWSYATTGADTKGDISIPQMQGMLKLLDPEMVKTGSNNAMQASKVISQASYDKLSSTDKAKYFQVGERFAPMGDEFHGRSTILQTRHLMESFRPDAPIVLDVKTPPPELQGYSNTVLLTDISSSMNDEMGFFSKIIEAGGIDGKMQMGTFIDREAEVQWSSASGTLSTTGAVTMSASQAQTVLDKQTELHNKKAERTKNEVLPLQQDLAKLKEDLKKSPNDQSIKDAISQKENDIKTKTDEINKATSPTGAFKANSKNMRESGVLGAIGALEDKPNKTGTGANTNQLVIFTDEQDATGLTPEETKQKYAELKKLAAEKGYDIKVVFASSDNKSFQIIDLNKVSEADLASSGAVTTKGTNDGGIDWSVLAATQKAKTYKWSETG